MFRKASFLRLGRYRTLATRPVASLLPMIKKIELQSVAPKKLFKEIIACSRRVSIYEKAIIMFQAKNVMNTRVGVINDHHVVYMQLSLHFTSGNRPSIINNSQDEESQSTLATPESLCRVRRVLSAIRIDLRNFTCSQSACSGSGSNESSHFPTSITPSSCAGDHF